MASRTQRLQPIAYRMGGEYLFVMRLCYFTEVLLELARWRQARSKRCSRRAPCVRLLDAHWVVAAAERGDVLLPRQALPDEAFISLSELQAGAEWRSHLPVFCISHCWLQVC